MIFVKDIFINVINDKGCWKEVEEVFERERWFIWFGLEFFGWEYVKIEEWVCNYI